MSLLNQAEAMIKLGDFLKAEERLQASQEIMDQVGSKKYQAAVKTNLALARSKIKGFGHYYRFITENEPKLMTGYIEQINPLVKTYFYYLNELANAKKLRRLIRKNVHINYKHIYEEEFYHNSLSLLAMAEKDYEKALVELKTATKFAGSINNNYAIAVFYILQITCYYGLRDLKKANELIEQAKPMIMEQNYNYWLNNIYVLEIKLNLLNPDVPLRSLLRRTNDVFTGCQDNQYYQFVIELYQIRLQILLEMGAETVATELFEEYRAYLDQVTEDVAEDDRQNFLAISHYGLKNLKKFDLVKITSRRKDIRNNWNDLLYNIANVNSVERIHFLIEKGLQQVISPYRFMLLEYSERYQDYFNVQCYNCGKDFAYDAELSDQARKAVKSDNLVITKYRGQNTCIVPLVTGAKAVGLLIVADNNELDFTKQELSILRSIKQHLSALLIRIRDYTQITKRIEKMNLLMQISHNLMRIVSIPDLEQEIVSAAISFSGSSRGFLIKKDKDGNNIYQVHLDSTGKVIPSISGVSKSVISTCQSTGQAVYSFNAIEDDQFKSSISVQDFQINAIFCAPI
ncbi:MAG TPA: GAF domain-containing protein, partial [Candidatus Cloacimonadota bacterium]|nr:GAF domain-containing protein [Candidatus Cloacimonadota bacterium]